MKAWLIGATLILAIGIAVFPDWKDNDELSAGEPADTQKAVQMSTSRLFKDTNFTRLGYDSAAPNFSLPSISGEEFSLEAFRGKIILLNFWATW